MARGGLLGYTVWQSQHGSRWWFEWGDLTSKWLSTKFRGTWFWGNPRWEKERRLRIPKSFSIGGLECALSAMGRVLAKTDRWSKGLAYAALSMREFWPKNGCFTDPDRSQIHDPSLCPNANALRPQRLQHQALWIRLDAIDKVLVVLDLRAVASVEHSV